MSYTKVLKQCAVLFLCLVVTLASTFAFEAFIIGRGLMSDRPLILQFYRSNKLISDLNLTVRDTVDVSVVSSGNLANLTSLRILISNSTVANATWIVPERNLEVSAFTAGRSEIFILGPSYGIAWVTLATLPVLVTE